VPQLKRPEDHESNIRALIPFCENVLLEDAPTAWHRYLEGAPKVTNSTHNRRGAILKRVCTLAAKWGWCLPGISARIELLPENPARHTYLTQPQVHRLVHTIRSQQTRDLCMIVAYTGLRPAEVLALARSDIQNGCLIVRTSKTGRPRVIPYHEAIREPVARLPIVLDYRTIQKHFHRARSVLRKPEWRIYDLRHTAASWLLQAGANLVTVRDMLGHVNLQMTSRYAHLDVSHLRAAVQRIKAPKK
jgi:integrase